MAYTLGPVSWRWMIELTDPYHTSKLEATGRESLVLQTTKFLTCQCHVSSSDCTIAEGLEHTGKELGGAGLGWGVEAFLSSVWCCPGLLHPRSLSFQDAQNSSSEAIQASSTTHIEGVKYYSTLEKCYNPEVLKKQSFEGNLCPSGISVCQYKEAVVGEKALKFSRNYSFHPQTPSCGANEYRVVLNEGDNDQYLVRRFDEYCICYISL